MILKGFDDDSFILIECIRLARICKSIHPDSHYFAVNHFKSEAHFYSPLLHAIFLEICRYNRICTGFVFAQLRNLFLNESRKVGKIVAVTVRIRRSRRWLYPRPLPSSLWKSGVRVPEVIKFSIPSRPLLVSWLVGFLVLRSCEEVDFKDGDCRLTASWHPPSQV